MCVRRSGNILFYFFVDNFTGSKDTEPYKTDVSFLCRYILQILISANKIDKIRKCVNLQFCMAPELMIFEP